VAIITCHYAVVDEGRKLRLKFRIYRGAYMVRYSVDVVQGLPGLMHTAKDRRQVWSLLRPAGTTMVTALRMRRVGFKGWDCRDNFKQNTMGQGGIVAASMASIVLVRET
jgi:hypothetical protein